jgi:alanine racemase
MPESYLDLVRPGVMMYGYYPSDETSESISILPAMTFKSRVSFIKNAPENFSVSYGRKFITSRPTKIATIPVGYADGYNRLLTNNAQVTIRGKKFPLVGRVCMDLVMADIGEDNDIQIGDEVILFGKSSENAMTVEQICQQLDTIPYEVTCWISKRVPRRYIMNK